jgi:Zn-finger nucleic acid-binding protein
MCPECGAPLVALELYGIEIDHCITCRGTWLDKGELAMIAERAKVESGELTDALYEMKASGPGKGRCPRCSKRLNSVVIPEEPPIQLDRCPIGHGLYFDKGEMMSTVSCMANCDDKEADAVARFFADMFKHELETEKEGE